MAGGNLLFGRALNPTGSLVFGADDGTAPAIGIASDSRLRRLRVQVDVVRVTHATAQVRTRRLRTEASGLWDSRTARPTVSRLQAAHEQGAALQVAAAQRYAQGDRQSQSTSVRWQAGAPLHSAVAAAYQRTQAAHRAVGAVWQSAASLRRQTGLSNQQGDATRIGISSRYQAGLGISGGPRVRSQQGVITRAALATHWQPGTASAQPVASRQSQGRPSSTTRRSHYQLAQRPPAGRSAWPIIPPGEPGYVPVGELRFCRPYHADGALLFGYVCDAPVGKIIVPIREYYIVISSASLQIESTGQLIECSDLTVGINASTFDWSWSATIPGVYKSLLDTGTYGEYVLLRAVVAGQEWLLLAERFSRSRQHPRSRMTVSGAARAKYLAAPTAPIESRSNANMMTAQQLAADALTLNGAPLGWAVDWQLDDWLVPAGAWSHTGTPMEAVTRIAEAGGGYVQADPASQILHVLPYFPVPAWSLSAQTPDIELPEDACTVENIDLVENPPYDSVFIVAQDASFGAHYKRTGTAGDRPAPTIVDALATAPEATRQRGRRVLGESGRRLDFTLKMQVHAETGVILPGKIIRYVSAEGTYVGITRGVQVAVEGGGAARKVRQSIRVETYVVQSV